MNTITSLQEHWPSQESALLSDMTLFTPVKPFAKINFPGGIFVVKKEKNTDYCLEIFSLTSLSQVSSYKVQNLQYLQV